MDCTCIVDFAAISPGVVQIARMHCPAAASFGPSSTRTFTPASSLTCTKHVAFSDFASSTLVIVHRCSAADRGGAPVSELLPGRHLHRRVAAGVKAGLRQQVAHALRSLQNLFFLVHALVPEDGYNDELR